MKEISSQDEDKKEISEDEEMKEISSHDEDKKEMSEEDEEKKESSEDLEKKETSEEDDEIMKTESPLKEIKSVNDVSCFLCYKIFYCETQQKSFNFNCKTFHYKPTPYYFSLIYN